MRSQTNLKMYLIMAVLLVAVVCMSCPALAVNWKVKQVTNNIDDDYNPHISGSNVVWERWDGSDSEIFFWDMSMSEPCQVTDNLYNDEYPQISGLNVVWEGKTDSGDYEIFFWEAIGIGEPCQVTDNLYNDEYPQISGSNVAWQSTDGDDLEIFYWNGTTITRVTDNSYNDISPQISGSNVVWQGLNDNDWEIFFWDSSLMGEPYQVTKNNYDDKGPRISGSNVVWVAWDGSDYEIFFWDGNTINQVTNNSYNDYNPQISGSNVVWEGEDGSDYEIFFWDGTTINRITNNSYNDSNPQISGSKVVWEAEVSSSPYDTEIFFWDGESTNEPIDISNSSIYDDYNPQISGTNIVWEGYNTEDYEIFMAFTITVIYVDADATGGAQNGKNWENAYLYLQDALDDPCLVSGGEIWVAAGAYKPDVNSADPNGSGCRTATFQLRNGVGIFGGYAGFGAAYPNERDINKYQTILSGDINSPGDNSDNSYHVVTGTGTEPNAVLDGFTITAGNANGPYNPYRLDRGGGMYNYDASPTVTRCTFSGNFATYGGGMYNWESSPMVTNSVFSGNAAVKNGGGLYSYNNSRPTVINCIFIGNLADKGGGMINTISSSPTVTNCTFSSNRAVDIGGGIVNLYNSSPTISNCILWGNTASSGAQIYNDETSAADVSYSDVQGGYNINMNADPLFVDANGPDGIAGTKDDNVHLRGYSPCINAGDPSGDYSDRLDIDGQSRVSYGRVDMGVDEVFPAAGDFEPDGDVDFADLASFALYWMVTDCGNCGGADLTYEGNVDFYDLKGLTYNWLLGL